jgi:aryl-alcohol dehydrogenase-like predicted oxidoreductase
MQYRALGGSGPEVSRIALGGADFGRRVDQRTATAVVSAALDAGVNFLDTAEAYPGSEAVVAKALRGRRHKVVVATKFGHPDYPDYPSNVAAGSGSNVRRAIEGSLRRLQTDHIDLYYIHYPDPVTPIAETLEAMNDLVTEGKVRFVGGCNFDGKQIAEAAAAARDSNTASFVAHQNSYSLVDRGVEKDVVAACQACGAGLVAFSPLARGLLSGRYRRDRPVAAGSRLSGSPTAPDDAAFDRVEALSAFASDRGISLVEVAIGGLLARDGVASIIVGASSPEQLLANVRAAAWVPTAEDTAAIDRASQ